jgi:hypothetical protein
MVEAELVSGTKTVAAMITPIDTRMRLTPAPLDLAMSDPKKLAFAGQVDNRIIESKNGD